MAKKCGSRKDMRKAKQLFDLMQQQMVDNSDSAESDSSDQEGASRKRDRQHPRKSSRATKKPHKERASSKERASRSGSGGKQEEETEEMNVNAITNQLTNLHEASISILKKRQPGRRKQMNK